MSDTQVVIGPVRLSYANVWEPKVARGATEAKYSTAVLIDKADKKNLAIVDKAIQAASKLGQEKFGSKWKKVKQPLRDGDSDNDGEAYEGMMFFNASSKNQPGIVDKQRQPIVDENEIYSGVYAYVSLNFYPFDNVNIGVAVGLNHIMKFKDGERLDGRVSADKAFAGVNFDDVDDLLSSNAEDDDPLDF